MSRPVAPNPAQQEVIDASLAGPRLVDAGAGTGKTQTLVGRVVRLCTTPDEADRLAPREILVVTFTRKAAGEIAGRIARELRARGIDETPTCTTFHALGYGLIREFAYLAGESPDVRAADDAQVRALAARAVADLRAGRSDAPTEAFPLLAPAAGLTDALIACARSLRERGVDAEAFATRALAATAALRRQTWGRTYRIGKRGEPIACNPKVERSAQERAAEADAEERNVAVVRALLVRLDGLLREAGLLTYVDQLRVATRIARRPEVQAVVRTRYRHALVDEFQDSAAPQLDLLRALCGDALDGVLVVGDARQAIYGFTGADPTLLRDFSRTARATHRLAINYRSHAPILDLAHAFRANADDGLLPPGDEPLVAHRGGHPDAVRIELFAEAEGEDRDAVRAREAAAVAAEIAELIAEGVEPREIALLMRARTHALTYAHALRDADVPFRLQGGAGFFEAPEIRDALAWLRLLGDPADVASLVRVLASPAIGVGDAALARLAARGFAEIDGAAPSDDPALVAPLARVAAFVERCGPLVAGPPDGLVAAVVREAGIDRARAALVPRAARRVAANLAKLERTAQSFVRARSAPTLGDLLAELDARAADDREPEADDARDAVAIMTIHGAKGLEWEYVFVVDVSPQTFPAQARGDGAIFTLDPRSGALALARLGDGRRTLRRLMLRAHDPRTGLLADGLEAAAKQEFEERRLAYVAFTRARRRLTVSGIEARVGGAKRGAPSAYLQELAEIVAARGLASRHTVRTRPESTARPASPPAASPPPASTESLAALPPQDGAVRAPRAEPLSYTAIAAARDCPRRAYYHYALGVPDLGAGMPSPAPTEAATPRAHEPPGATWFGTLVHRALELHAGARASGDALDAAAASARACDEEDVGGPLRARVRRATALAAAALADWTPLAAEQPFDLVVGGARVQGYVDLVARDPAGRRCVVDYKTGAQPAERFALQLAVYRAAVRDDEESPDAYVLRIAEGSATFERVPVATDAELAQAVAHACAVLGGDDVAPRPSARCGRCSFAEGLCPEGAADRRVVLPDRA